MLDGPRHGYNIIKDIEDRTDGDLMLGTSTLYSAVKRMVKGGLVEEIDPPAEAESQGPKRRYYGATALGQDVAREEARRIRQLDRIVSRTKLLGKI